LFELSGAHASYEDLCAVLVDWKQDKEKETDWRNEAPSQALQQSLKNLEAAPIAEPGFKKKEKRRSGGSNQCRKGTSPDRP